MEDEFFIREQEESLMITVMAINSVVMFAFIWMKCRCSKEEAVKGVECAICLETMERVPVLKHCRHRFHYECIESMLEAGIKVCPLCRASLKVWKRCDFTCNTCRYGNIRDSEISRESDNIH